MKSPVARTFRVVAVYVAIIAVSLVAADLILIVTGLFPPPFSPGDPDVGWVSAHPSGRIEQVSCVEWSSGERYQYVRNQDGARSSFSSVELQGKELFKIAIAGDSQTELCAPNELTHFGVLQRELAARGVPAAAFSRAAGKYSPLQAYLAVKELARKYSADAIVLNFYTGNDVYDMLRIDDRPHFVRAGQGYRIAEPIWYQEDRPDRPRQSRVLYAMTELAKRSGVWGVGARLRYLSAIAAEQEKGPVSVLAYMNDLRKSASSELGYSAAFAAQMLNQQLFFHRFEGSREESMRRVRALLELIRSENPDALLVLTALPSYQLTVSPPVSPRLLEVLERLPIDYEHGVREEALLYEQIKTLTEQTGWLFVDALAALKAYSGPERLYNDFDYHFLPVASDLIGTAQAQVIAAHIRNLSSNRSMTAPPTRPGRAPRSARPGADSPVE